MEPIVVTDSARRKVVIAAASDELVVTETRYVPGERGPEPHVHHEHVDCFYVLEGAFTLTLEDGEHVVGPETFVAVPRDVVHSFRNDGPDDLRYLNVHAPGMSFDRYVLGLYDGERQPFDQYPRPDDGGLDPAGVVVRATGEADVVEVSGNRIAFLAEADETEGMLGAIEFTAPRPFAGPPAHVHREFCDLAYVLEGTLEALLDGRRQGVEAGSCFLALPEAPHTFSSSGDEPLRFLNLYAPAGFERFFRERAAAPDANITARYDWTRA